MVSFIISLVAMQRMDWNGTRLEARRPVRLLQSSKPGIIESGKGKNWIGSRYS